MSDFFSGKKLLVVGGTSGMGLETARMVLKAGGSVVLTGSRKDKADAVQKELSPLGPVSVITANLMTEEGMNVIREEINAHHRDISLMVNAAGIFIPKSFTEHNAADYDSYLSLNRATFFITQDVVKNMLADKREGAIVNVGSIGAQAALGDSPASAYSMAKAGLHALTRNLAIELASAGIRVNAVSPGIVQTPIYEGFMAKEDIADAMKAMSDFHPLGRVGMPEDVANTILFLLSDKAAWVVSFFSAPLHVVDSELQRVPVKTDACIVAVVADTHGFCNFFLRQTVIERQKIIFQPERPHTQCIRWVLLQPGDEPCHRHIITTCRTRRQDAIGDVVPAPVIALRYGFQQGL